MAPATVTAIKPVEAKFTETVVEPGTVPIDSAKKTRERDVLSRASTLARALQKVDAKINEEIDRNEAKLAKLKAERDELISKADVAVLEKAQKLLEA